MEGSLDTASNLHSDSIQQDVNEEEIALGRDVEAGKEHFVIAALHKVLF